MNPSLVLSHQNVILLTLLLRFDLRIQRVYVLLFHFLLLHLSLAIKVVHVVNPVCSLAGVQFIIFPLELFLRLLFKHLKA